MDFKESCFGEGYRVQIQIIPKAAEFLHPPEGNGAYIWEAFANVFSFHGTADNTVPYDIGIALNNPELVTYGSACMHRVLTRIGVNSKLKPFVGMGHGWPASGDPRADTIVTMTTQFVYDVLFDKSG